MTAERQRCNWERIFHLVHIIGYFCQSLLHFLHIAALFLKLRAKIQSNQRFELVHLSNCEKQPCIARSGDEWPQRAGAPVDPTACKADLVHSPSCAYTCVWLLAAHLIFSLFLFFPFRLLSLAEGCKGAEPRSWQETFLFPCGFFPSFLSGSLGNCAAFPVKSEPLPQDHTACYILT